MRLKVVSEIISLTHMCLFLTWESSNSYLWLMITDWRHNRDDDESGSLVYVHRPYIWSKFITLAAGFIIDTLVICDLHTWTLLLKHASETHRYKRACKHRTPLNNTEPTEHIVICGTWYALYMYMYVASICPLICLYFWKLTGNDRYTKIWKLFYVLLVYARFCRQWYHISYPWAYAIYY